jgi:hypothetical protein
MSDVNRWYIAGPMSGIPQFNIPAFDAAARALRDRGWNVISPAELDDPEFREMCLASKTGTELIGDKTWGDLLARDVKIVADQVAGLILLPGWSQSRGARLEVFVGLLCYKCFMSWGKYVKTSSLRSMSADEVRFILEGNMP